MRTHTKLTSLLKMNKTMSHLEVTQTGKRTSELFHRHVNNNKANEKQTPSELQDKTLELVQSGLVLSVTAMQCIQ